MKKNFISLCILSMCAFSDLHAQVTYDYVKSTGTYEEFSGTEIGAFSEDWAYTVKFGR